MGIVMEDEGLAWYWLSHPSWQGNSQLGQSAGLFWEHLSPFMSTHSWESSWKGVLDLSVANNKMIYDISVVARQYFSLALGCQEPSAAEEMSHGMGAACLVVLIVMRQEQY